MPTLKEWLYAFDFDGRPLFENATQLGLLISNLSGGQLAPESAAKKLREAVQSTSLDEVFAEALLLAVGDRVQRAPVAERDLWLKGVHSECVKKRSQPRTGRGRPSKVWTTTNDYRSLIQGSIVAVDHFAAGFDVSGLRSPQVTTLRNLMLKRLGLIEDGQMLADSQLGDFPDSNHFGGRDVRYTILLGDELKVREFFRYLLEESTGINGRFPLREFDGFGAASRHIHELVDGNRLRVYAVPAEYVCLPLIVLDVDLPSRQGFSVYCQGESLSLCRIIDPILINWKSSLHMRFQSEALEADRFQNSPPRGSRVRRVAFELDSAFGR